MLGVVNKAIDAFVCQRYGDKLWTDLRIDLSLPEYEFEVMLTYEDGITYDLIDRLADTDQTECIEVILIDHHHSAGTSFDLAASS